MRKLRVFLTAVLIIGLYFGFLYLLLRLFDLVIIDFIANVHPVKQ